MNFQNLKFDFFGTCFRIAFWAPLGRAWMSSYVDLVVKGNCFLITTWYNKYVMYYLGTVHSRHGMVNRTRLTVNRTLFPFFWLTVLTVNR